jgi:hypothetical protein
MSMPALKPSIVSRLRLAASKCAACAARRRQWQAMILAARQTVSASLSRPVGIARPTFARRSSAEVGDE